MNRFLPAAQWAATLVFLGVAGYVLFVQAAPFFSPPCSTPLTYTVGEIDPRFGIHESALRDDLAAAAAVWNEAAGTSVLAYAEEGTIPVHLVYSEEQRAAELGKTIDNEQKAYDAQKDALTDMKRTFTSMKHSYERAQASYEKKRNAYESDVAYWNAQGGAPSSTYQELQLTARELEQERQELNTAADQVNAYSAAINSEVTKLNELARKINTKVNVYNESAGEDFDQGNYQSDRDGKRITIYEYTDRADLERVLAHEFGHALGIGHVENPESIMYSFNLGEGLTLSAEDTAALRQACRLDS